MTTTQVLVGVDVRTMDRASPHADAVAWRGEHLLAVGARADVLHAAGPDAVVRDVGGATRFRLTVPVA
jgi:predicted amidohydrolase YtcJ